MGIFRPQIPETVAYGGVKVSGPCAKGSNICKFFLIFSSNTASNAHNNLIGI